MGTSTRYSSGDEPGIRDRAPSLALEYLTPQPAELAAKRAAERDHHPDPAVNDIGRILSDIRDTLANARADIAELLRNSHPPNDHP